MSTLLKLVKAVASVGGVQFASLTYRAKSTNELARYTVILGASYLSCVKRSLDELNTMTFSSELDKQAQVELLASFQETLDKHAIGEKNSAYTKTETYVDTAIDGLKINVNDNSLQLFGLSTAKVVLEPGAHKAVNSKPLTIAKNKIRATLPIGKFREFALDYATLESARVNGNVLEF
jgi:hypothetical protein